VRTGVTASGQPEKREVTDKELVRRYNQGQSIHALAKQLGRDFSTVKARLQQSGVQVPPNGRGRRRAPRLILAEFQAAGPGPQGAHLHEVYQTVACPSCGAGVGQHCVTRNGWRAVTPHAARFQAAPQSGAAQ
jgi:hypothetical protein